jgi:hypothetical protein
MSTDRVEVASATASSDAIDHVARDHDAGGIAEGREDGVEHNRAVCGRRARLSLCHGPTVATWREKRSTIAPYDASNA